jgi:predicted transcriptional regulator
MKLGNKQLEYLSFVVQPGLSYIVGNKVLASLVRRGLMASASSKGDSFYHITAQGLRILADEADAGRLRLAPDLEKIRKRNEEKS